MLKKAFKYLYGLSSASVPEPYQAEFDEHISRLNLFRAKITASAFIFFEAIVMTVTSDTNRDSLFSAPHVYYFCMYATMILAMAAYRLVFEKIGKKTPVNGKSLHIAVISFTCFLLCWFAGISLLDQASSVGDTVYSVALIAIATTLVFKPPDLLYIYLPVHTAYLILLPHFTPGGSLPFANTLNSSMILIIAFVISIIRYQNQVVEFKNAKILKEKNNELERLNRELEEANKKLEKLSQTDGLTGIANRFMFDQTIQAEWDRCKRQFQPLSLLMIDIDFFKLFNDHYGHQAGDDCVKQVAGVLLACAKRSTDTVARYGGDEFAVILPYLEKENATELAEQIREKIEKLDMPHAFSPISSCLTVSIGVNTVTPSNENSVEEFINDTDKALYEAKMRRNNAVIA